MDKKQAIITGRLAGNVSVVLVLTAFVSCVLPVSAQGKPDSWPLFESKVPNYKLPLTVKSNDYFSQWLSDLGEPIINQDGPNESSVLRFLYQPSFATPFIIRVEWKDGKYKVVTKVVAYGRFRKDKGDFGPPSVICRKERQLSQLESNQFHELLEALKSTVKGTEPDVDDGNEWLFEVRDSKYFLVEGKFPTSEMQNMGVFLAKATGLGVRRTSLPRPVQTEPIDQR